MIRVHREARRGAAMVLLGAMLLAIGGESQATRPMPPPPPAQPPLALRLIAVNDFHGNLEPPTGSSGRVIDAFGNIVPAGGAAYLAAHLQQLRAGRNAEFIATGDLIGQSPLVSAVFHDEPTIQLFRQLGMRASAAGRQDFHEGYDELLRLQRGGCHPTDGCQFSASYRGSGFPFLGANVWYRGTQLPALLPSWISFVQGIPVGYIGITARDTPAEVPASGISRLSFGPEVATANLHANLLDLLGVKVIVLLLHQGDSTAATSRPDSCELGSTVGRDIARAVSPKIDVVFSAASHQAYNCSVTDPAGQPRPYIQGSSFGRMLSVVDLQIDRKTRDVIRAGTTAFNRVVTRDVVPDAAAQALVDEAKTKAAPIANRVIGSITADISRVSNSAGESPLGNLIADAQLSATAGAGAQIAFMNPGGVRTDLSYASVPGGESPGQVLYGEAFTVQPFGNVLVTMTLTGAQIKAALEQQWNGPITRILSPSAGFSYTYSDSLPIGSRTSNLALNGTPLDPAASYRVTVNNFLSGGGDGFSVFTGGVNLVTGAIDLDALVAYLGAYAPVAPPPLNRITRQ